MLEEAEEQRLRDANPEGVTYVLAEITAVGEYVAWVDDDCAADGVAEVVVDCVFETDAD